MEYEHCRDPASRASRKIGKFHRGRCHESIGRQRSPGEGDLPSLDLDKTMEHALAQCSIWKRKHVAFSLHDAMSLAELGGLNSFLLDMMISALFYSMGSLNLARIIGMQINHGLDLVAGDSFFFFTKEMILV